MRDFVKPPYLGVAYYPEDWDESFMKQDIAMMKLHVVFAIDRAGLVGEDGETHQGIYDVAYLSHLPNMTVLSPADDVSQRQANSSQQ